MICGGASNMGVKQPVRSHFTSSEIYVSECAAVKKRWKTCRPQMSPKQAARHNKGLIILKMILGVASKSEHTYAINSLSRWQWTASE